MDVCKQMWVEFEKRINIYIYLDLRQSLTALNHRNFNSILNNDCLRETTIAMQNENVNKQLRDASDSEQPSHKDSLMFRETIRWHHVHFTRERVCCDF